jgi:hypothetical protein
LLKPNNSAAFADCGLVNFIWPSRAPVIRTGILASVSLPFDFRFV